jgi:hypothetical protein
VRSLLQWDVEVRPALDMIEAGAEICSRFAARLPVRPDFETSAEIELVRAEKLLETALANVRKALVIYREKEIEP